MAECKETGCTNFNGGADKCAICDSKDQQIADLQAQGDDLRSRIAEKDRVIEVLADRLVDSAHSTSSPAVNVVTKRRLIKEAKATEANGE